MSEPFRPCSDCSFRLTLFFIPDALTAKSMVISVIALYFRMFTIANVSYSPDLKSHLPCIVNGFKTLVSQSRSCWTDFAEKASKIIPSVTAAQDVDKIAEDMCR